MTMIDVFPLEPWAVVTSGFGMRWGRPHNGTDYGSPNPGERTINQTPIRAPFAGTVTTGTEWNGAGQWSWVDADDGRARFKSFHHSAWEVRSGHVDAGQVIAYVGSTGASTGPHAHLELWVDGRPIDPEPALEAARRRPTIPPATEPVPEEDDVTPEQMDTLGRWMQEQAANVIASTNAKIDALAWGIVAGNVKVLEAVNKAAAGGGQVDVDAIAAEVADEIAQRLQG